METSKPSKQRARLYKAALHKKAATMSVHVDKVLRKQINRRAIGIRTGDKVTIIKGSLKGKSGKVNSVNSNKGFIFIDGITRKKSDGTEINVPFRSPNLVITDLETKDGKRFKRGKKPVKKISGDEKAPKKKVKEKKEDKKKGEK